MIRLDGEAGTLEALVDADDWAAREAAADTAPAPTEHNTAGDSTAAADVYTRQA